MITWFKIRKVDEKTLNPGYVYQNAYGMSSSLAFSLFPKIGKVSKQGGA
jgi:hypothetical protein